MSFVMETNFCFIHKHWKFCSVVTFFIYRNMNTIYTDVIFKVSHLHKSYFRKLNKKNNLNETVPFNNNKNKALLNKKVRFTKLLSHFYFDWNYYKSEKCGSFVTCVFVLFKDKYYTKLTLIF